MEYKEFIEAIKKLEPGNGLPNKTERNLHIAEYPLEGTAYPCKIYCRFFVQTYVDEGPNKTHESFYRTMIVNGTAVPTKADFYDTRATASRVRSSIGEKDKNTAEEVFSDMADFYQPFIESINIAYCKGGWYGSGHNRTFDAHSYLKFSAISEALSAH